MSTMPPKTKQNLSSLTKKPTTAIPKKKRQNCWRITETQKKKKTDLPTTTLNRTMENTKNPNSARFVFSLLLLRFHYNTRLLPFSSFFLSPFFLFPFFLSFFPLSSFLLALHKENLFLTLSIFTPAPTHCP